MQTTLNKIANIQLGRSFRGRMESSLKGNTHVIQMRDLGAESIAQLELLRKVDLDRLPESQIVETGDLLFRSRGQTINSLLVEKVPEPAIAAAPLFRIRVKDPNRVSPLYLNWYLNQSDAQRYFHSRHEGSAVRMVNRVELGELVVAVPALELQKAIVELAELAKEQAELMNTISRKRTQVITTQLLQLARGNQS